MKMSEIVRDIVTRRRCRYRHRAMVADLEALSDRLLEDIGLWRGAIPAAAAEILSSQGCPVPARRAPSREDLEPTTDQAT